MIDIKFLRENPEAVKENIRKKFQDSKLPLVDEVIALDEELRQNKKRADDLRANRNKISKSIGALMGQKKFAEAERALLGCLKAEHGKGIYTLGCLNEFGLGIPTNRERAFKLYECAFDLGFRDPRAVYKLVILRMARSYK